jgi:hypothetical protein
MSRNRNRHLKRTWNRRKKFRKLELRTGTRTGAGTGTGTGTGTVPTFRGPTTLLGMYQERCKVY